MPATTMITLMNTILANASAEYVARVPLATRTNLDEVGAPILTFQATQNEFLSALINKIVMQIVNNRVAQNPLRVLKKGGMPLGKYIEEMQANPAKASAFDGTGATLLTVVKPDLKTQYHALNRQDTYTVTISNQQLRTAFKDWSKLEELIAKITGTLYSGDNYDEFVLMKSMMQTAVADGKVITIECDAIADATTAKDFVKAVKTTSMLMTFPSGNFNKYLANKPITDLSTDPLITWTPTTDQVLIIRADIMAQIDLEVLAVAFNLSKVELEQMTLIVDSFGGDPLVNDVYALLADKAFFQIYDNLQEMAEFYNGKGLYWNYFYHHWQTYSFSLFANCVAFVKKQAI
jgi:hypothetical protein